MKSETISVLVIEQQPMMRTALSTTLSSAGINVLDEVTDGKQALLSASKQTPNLILYSIHVLSLDDLQYISTLRQTLPNTRILALVTGEFNGQVNSALEHGADRVLTKTALRTEILSTVQAMTQ
jgi:DNA-binding NarL/FixJ family response regulator